MKINIIGSGWLALPLAQQLQQQGHDLLLTTTSQEKVKSIQSAGLGAITYELGDQLSEPALLFETDVLIVAITCKDVESFEVLMDQLSEQKCRHIIFISSTSVYLNNGKTHDEDSTALSHDNPLLTIESLIQQHRSATIIRFAGLVGPGRHPGRFFRRSGIISNPEAPVNLIHLDDCIGIIEAVLEQKAWNEIFNGCADNHPSKGEYYQHMAKQAGMAMPALGTATSGSNKIIDNSKVKAHLHHKLKYPDVFKMTFS
jgi:nucleoside-diphosphate-sugar epimerase